jgi:hypothetical protein
MIIQHMQMCKVKASWHLSEADWEDCFRDLCGLKEGKLRGVSWQVGFLYDAFVERLKGHSIYLARAVEK